MHPLLLTKTGSLYIPVTMRKGRAYLIYDVCDFQEILERILANFYLLERFEYNGRLPFDYAIINFFDSLLPTPTYPCK